VQIKARRTGVLGSEGEGREENIKGTDRTVYFDFVGITIATQSS
jgi:hypothetical protein